MAIKKVYVGSIGPFEYDDTEPVNDADGDFAGETQCGLLTNGQIKILGTPTIRHFTLNSSGTYDVNDLGFVPKIVGFLCIDSTATNLNWSIGFDNGTVRGNIVIYDGGIHSGHATTCAGQVTRDVSNNIYTLISSFLSSGFRLTSTLTGTCSMEVIAVCFP